MLAQADEQAAARPTTVGLLCDLAGSLIMCSDVTCCAALCCAVLCCAGVLWYDVLDFVKGSARKKAAAGSLPLD